MAFAFDVTIVSNHVFCNYSKTLSFFVRDVLKSDAIYLSIICNYVSLFVLCLYSISIFYVMINLIIKR